MRSIRILAIVAALGSSAGCTLIANGTRNVVNEPRLALDECRFRHKCRALAREAWSRRADIVNASADFRDGYLDGYADFLRAGRTTDPWPAPPDRYQRAAYYTPRALKAVDDYTAGFHEGATAAAASGDRQHMVLPIVVPTASPPPAIGPPVEVLPAPKDLATVRSN